MKKVFLLLMVTGLITINVFGQKKETRSVSGFTGIDASSVFDITVTKGSTESLTIEADNDVMQYVRSEVQNGVLRLYIDNNKVKNIKRLKASVVMQNLDKVSLSGACKFTVNDMFAPDKFKANCSGVANMVLNVNTGQLNIDTSGASKIRIKANVTGDTYMNVSGTAKIQSELNTSKANINSSGASSVELTGSANDFEIYLSGTAKLKAEDFSVKTATIKASGASKVTVNVSDALKVNSSGTASVNYKGSPTLEVSSSKASKVRKI